MKTIKTLGWLLLFCLPFQTFGQKTTVSRAELIKKYTVYKNIDPSLNHLNYFERMRGDMQLSEQSKMVLLAENAGLNGYRHFKYQQFQAGVPIFGSQYTLHEKDGKIATATGQYRPLLEANAKPGITAATAAAFARHAMQARKYADRMPEPKLVFIDPAFPKVSEHVRLAYQVDLHATTPFDKRRYFVDAGSGKIITEFPLILQESVPSKAQTRYYGVQNITTDSIAPQSFVLRDLSRGGGIFVNNGQDNSFFTSTSSTWNLTNANKDEIALDAHYCTQEYYDMMLADYNWQGQDGQGKALQAYVHVGNFANAYWDGEATSYGDGDCSYGPLTTLEVVGHEFTHGMIDYTSQLVYNSESGAINESLADMFGKMLERTSDPANFSWDLGHSFLLSPNAQPFRIMDDPKSIGMPAYYQGEFWEDDNGVHTNSSIGNLWFSMLVDGKQGINEAGIDFDVPAIGAAKAGQIVFQVNKNYFTSGSDYPAFYQYSVDVAEALYGAGSTEVQAVEEAWKAVGLSGTSNVPVFDLGFSTDNFEVNHSCGLNEFIPVSFFLQNRGNVAYTPSMQGSVLLTVTNGNLPDYTVPLNSSIAPGEVFEIQVNNWLTTDFPDFIFVNAILNLQDADENNNLNTAYYDVHDLPAKDMSVDAYLPTADCFASEQLAILFVANENCDPVPAGTVLNFTITDNAGNLLWTPPAYTMTEDLAGFATVFIDFTMPTMNGDLVLNLFYNGDTNTDNDQASLEKSSYPAITGNYANDFETNAGEDGYLELVGQLDLTVPYQNSNFFACTGLFDDPNGFTHCADPLSAFDDEYNSGINATIHACIDFSGSPAPRLDFDLAQFRNTSTDTSNYVYSSMLQTKWTGNGSGEVVTFGQPEGLVEHHTIQLPPFFKGALDFKLYAEIGQWGVSADNFGKDDFVLLDNLQLSAPTSATHEQPADAGVVISPNPAWERVSIRAGSDIKNIQLQNLNGQILQTWLVNAPSQQLDLQGRANGFYLLNIQLANGQIVASKLVKMN